MCYSMAKQGPCVTRWVFTLNNYTDENVNTLKEKLCESQVNYLIVGKEVGEKGTPHLQGCVNMKKKRRLTAMKKLIPGAHFEPAKGTDKQNKDYCSKEKVLIEIGQPQSQGKRNDLESALAVVKAAKGDLKSLDKDHAVVFAKYARGIRDCIATFGWDKDLERDWKTEVTVITGPPACGKSMLAKKLANGKDVYFKPPNHKWWTKYRQQEVVIINEFYGWIPHCEMLVLCDRDPTTVETKGGHVEFNAKHVIITSNAELWKWYAFDKFDPVALMRRVTSYLVWKDGDFVELSTLPFYCEYKYNY